MDRDDIIRMAHGAQGEALSHGMWSMHIEDLERFAALVAAATRESMKSEGWRACAVGQHETQHCGLLETAVLVEREACARVCESHAAEWRHLGGMVGSTSEDIAVRIRARSDQ